MMRRRRRKRKNLEELMRLFKLKVCVYVCMYVCINGGGESLQLEEDKRRKNKLSKAFLLVIMYECVSGGGGGGGGGGDGDGCERWMTERWLVYTSLILSTISLLYQPSLVSIKVCLHFTFFDYLTLLILEVWLVVWVECLARPSVTLVHHSAISPPVHSSLRQ